MRSCFRAVYISFQRNPWKASVSLKCVTIRMIAGKRCYQISEKILQAKRNFVAAAVLQETTNFPLVFISIN